MLAIKPTRSLIYRGIHTSAANKAISTAGLVTTGGLFNYPNAEKNSPNQLAYVIHPNRNYEYQETGHKPFPLSPRFANKDARLNELREKSYGDWGALSKTETRKLYDGHFRCPYHAYFMTNDVWKLWFGIWGTQLVILSLMLRMYWNWMEMEHPEYASDERYITEMLRQRLMYNWRPMFGHAHSYNYADGEWKEKHWWDRFTGLFDHLKIFPHPPTDGTQMGFTYLQKK